jgi:hypothetical protein
MSVARRLLLCSVWITPKVLLEDRDFGFARLERAFTVGRARVLLEEARDFFGEAAEALFDVADFNLPALRAAFQAIRPALSFPLAGFLAAAFALRFIRPL